MNITHCPYFMRSAPPFCEDCPTIRLATAHLINDCPRYRKAGQQIYRESPNEDANIMEYSLESVTALLNFIEKTAFYEHI